MSVSVGHRILLLLLLIPLPQLALLVLLAVAYVDPRIPQAVSLHLDCPLAEDTCNSPECPFPTTRTVAAAVVVGLSVDGSESGNSIACYAIVATTDSDTVDSVALSSD